MEQYWYLLVLVAAFSHSLWNFILKSSENKQIFLFFLRSFAVLIFFPFSILFYPDEGIALKYLLFFGIGSSIIHSIYGILLAKAYDKTDFTLAYPVARGTGPLLVVFVGIVLLGEPINGITIFGAILIFIGIYLLYSGLHYKSFVTTTKIVLQSPYPLLVGISIASYTIFDKIAVAFIPPITLGVIENFGQVLVLGRGVFKKYSKEKVVDYWKKNWYNALFAGSFSGLAYILVLIVLTTVPVSHVAPIRESSIVIGALLGFIFLKESFSINKVIGSIVIFIGVILIILS